MLLGAASALKPGPVEPTPDFEFRAPEAPENVADRLHQSGVRFAGWPVKPTRLASRVICEAPSGVRILRGASGLRFSKPPRVNGAFALRMIRFEQVMQEEARQAFGRPVARIEHLGTYNCRMMAAYPDWVSEHSFANAIDVAVFVLTDGRRVVVEKDWVPQDRPADRPASAFLRKLARRLFDEDVFSVVLTPSFDKHHRNHFHLDGASYRVDGT